MVEKNGDCNYRPFRDQAVVGVSSVNSATASHLSPADEIPSVHGENVIAPRIYICTYVYNCQLSAVSHSRQIVIAILMKFGSIWIVRNE